MAEKRTTSEFGGYETNSIKTLGDLFSYETALVKQLDTLKTDLQNKRGTKEEALIKKQMKDLQDGYSKVYTKALTEAENLIKKEQKAREQMYVELGMKQQALLKKQLEEELSKRLKAIEKEGKKKGKSDEEIQREKDAAENKVQEARIKRADKEALIDAKEAQKANRNAILESSSKVFGGVGTIGEQMTASLTKVGENLGKSIGKAFNDISNKINSAMETYSKYQSAIDTRLQDSGKTFEEMQNALKRAVGASPYLKTETMLSNLQTLVETGIVTNVEQRAFLNTIKDKVAATFDAANGSLLRIIRLQQNDSTAVRLGMEAYLTSFLNRVVENTEYLSSTFDSVQEALLEASSIMTTKASTEFEYVVQKWLGVLTGRGLSETTATQLAGALGMLGSGNVSGLAGNSMNNLLVMAAANADLDYANLLTNGLTAENTNLLMKALVTYMQDINNSGNKVVRSQYAQTFGLSISDLMAATGMTQEEVDSVTKDMLTIDSMFSELGDQLNKVSSRTHISEKISNLFENAQFSLASNIAGNAVMAAMWKVTDMIQGVTGGINIPMISVFGSAIDLETTVENLLKLGLVGIGSLGMIGDIATGLSQTGSGFSGVLSKLNITRGDTTDIISRLRQNYTSTSTGSGLRSRRRGFTTSATNSLISNSSGEDIGDQTLNAAMDESNKKLEEQSEAQDNPMNDLRDYFLNVFDSRFVNLIDIIASANGYSKSGSTSLLTSLLSGSNNTTIHDISFDTTKYVLDSMTASNAPMSTTLSNIQMYLMTVLDNRIASIADMTASLAGYSKSGESSNGVGILGSSTTSISTYSVVSGVSSSPIAAIQHYLIDVFDAKFSNLMAMIAHTGGYAQAGTELPVFTAGSNVIRTTYQVDNDLSSNQEILSNIESNVSNIFNLLSTGVISVNVESMPSSYGISMGSSTI